MEANEARMKRESRAREGAQKGNFFAGVRLAFRARLVLASVRLKSAKKVMWVLQATIFFILVTFAFHSAVMKLNAS